MKSRKHILKEAGILLIIAIMLLSAFTVTATTIKKGSKSSIENTTNEGSRTLVWYEYWSGAAPPALPPGWATTHTNWKTSNTNYAGGPSGAPEAMFYYYPSSNDYFRLYTTTQIDLTGHTGCELYFWHYVNDYTGDYDLMVEMLPNGAPAWIPIWTQPGGPAGPVRVGPISLAGSSNLFDLSITFSGDSYNINFWYIDDIEIICCGGDTTPPITTHTFDPPAPNGLIGWYVSCVTVTLDATDTESGVCMTEYRLDGAIPVEHYGPWPFDFTVCDCTQEIEYRSTDCCANVEAWNGPIILKIDTDPPFFNSFTAAVSGSFVIVDADVDDLCSGVVRVEFYKDGSPTPSFTDTTGPPWTYTYLASSPPPNTIQAIAYDEAGNSAASAVINPQSQPQQQSSHQSSSQQSTVPLFFQILQQILNI